MGVPGASAQQKGCGQFNQMARMKLSIPGTADLPWISTPSQLPEEPTHFITSYSYIFLIHQHWIFFYFFSG